MLNIKNAEVDMVFAKLFGGSASRILSVSLLYLVILLSQWISLEIYYVDSVCKVCSL